MLWKNQWQLNYSDQSQSAGKIARTLQLVLVLLLILEKLARDFFANH